MKYSSLALLLCCLPALTIAAGTPINELRPLVADGRLKVSNVQGRVELHAWDRNEVRITGTLGDGTEALDIEGDANQLSIEVRTPKQSWSWGWNSGGVKDTDLRIDAPARVLADLRTVSADVRVEGHRGARISIATVSGDMRLSDVDTREMSLKTVSGDIDLEHLGNADRIELATVSGDIEGRNLGGELAIETVSGDAEVEAHSVKRLDGRLVSGDLDIVIHSVLAGARIEMESVSGDLHLRIPDDLGLRLECETFSGSIRSSWGDVKKASYGPGQRIDAEVGDGDVRIRARTMSGNLELKSL